MRTEKITICGPLFVLLIYGALHVMSEVDTEESETDPADESQKLMVVLLDGFRWDFVNRGKLKNFRSLKKKGVHAGYMISDFPSLSFPNCYTILTGLHPESHGITGNYMYDVARRQYFLMGRNPDSLASHWWDRGQPIWVTAAKQNKRSYVSNAIDCDLVIQGERPTFCIPRRNFTAIAKVDSILQTTVDKLIESDGADFAFITVDEPDISGHRYGPHSDEMLEILEKLDVALGNLVKRLDSLPNTAKVNLLVLSDHGITSVSPKRIINITDALSDPTLYVAILGFGSVTSIYTETKAKTNKVYKLLNGLNPKMKVYKRTNIPTLYSYKKGPYVGNITCVADNSWFILHPQVSQFPVFLGGLLKGYHGYVTTEQDMRGIFYGYGPYFKAGAKVKTMHVTDPYNLMCDIMGLTPEPNNGSRSAWKPLVVKSGDRR